LRELDVGDSDFILKIAEFLRKVLPDGMTTPNLGDTPSKLQAIHLGTTPTPQPPKQSATATESKHVAATRLHSVAIPSTSSTSEVFETPKKERHASSDDASDNADDYEAVDEDVRAFGRSNFGAIASPYLTPYLYNKRFLDKQYGIRRDGDSFMIGDSAVTVVSRSEITINDKTFRGTKGLWELLTRKKVDETLISKNDLNRYKNILEMTNAHLEGYEPGGDIHISRGQKFVNVISKLFPQTRRRGIEAQLRRRWVTYD
jgi:hypothetical protein